MTAKEILRAQIQLLIPAIGALFVVTFIFGHIFGREGLDMLELLSLIIFAFVCVGAFFIFWSKERLVQAKLAIRYVIHLVFTLILATALLVYGEWISLELSYLIITLPLQILAYVTVSVFDEVNTRRLAAKLTTGLEKYQKSHQPNNN